MNEMTLTPALAEQTAASRAASGAVTAAAAVQKTAPAARAGAVQDTLKMPVLLSGWAARSATNGIDTARLFAFGMDLQTWSELAQMQQAIVERLTLQQQSWLQGWAAWNRERAEIRGANTVTKLVEQEFNLIAQIGQLLIDQTTNLVALQENIEVSYAYWLNQKLGALSSTAGVQTPVAAVARA
ncbi:hypothetical protein G3N95_21725 [Paraburkholderia sp. Tr-20389]|uniref:hypothetical protein n=1 Tax=Paraburkholderia sp. Tr-20389 TaxID=2703903 RepID=UPI00197D59AB|nr:hypothetical protein [Paraburkholderia sp. Tr-20389]MBN3755577.1 hypothetical protein [Paraburkholderia sp. Tr-20389]